MSRAGLILNHMAFARHLVWWERRDGLPRIMIRDRRTGEEHAIAFAEEAYSLGLQGGRNYDTDVIRFSYSSMTTPSQLYDYNMATRERVLLKTRKCHLVTTRRITSRGAGVCDGP